jgi:hypothetical protein
MLREDFQVWNELGGKIQTPRLPVCAQDTDAERSRVGFAACNQDDRKHEGRLAVSIALLLGLCSAPSPCDRMINMVGWPIASPAE